MSLRKFIFVLVGELIFFSHLGLFAHAEESNSLSTFYVKHGQELFDQGRIKSAVSKFTKALLLDGNNTAAKTYLQKIYQESELWEVREQYQLTHFLELVDYCQFLKDRLKNLKTSNDDLLNFISDHEKKDEDLLAIKKIQTDLETKYAGSDFGSPEPLSAPPVIDELDMEKIIEALLKQKNSFLQELESLQKINDQLRSIRKKTVEKILTLPDSLAQKETAQYITEIEAQLAEKTITLQRQEQKLSTVIEELDQVRHAFADLQNKMTENDKRVAELTRNLAGMSLDLYEKDALITEKGERIRTLENELQDVQGRLSLSRHLNDAKDNKNHFTKNGMVDLDTAMTNLSRMPAVEGPLDHHSSSQAVKDKDQLKMNIVKTQELDEQFKILKKEYLHLKKRARHRDKEINQLYGILDIYKWKLYDTSTALNERDKRLDRLEAQLLKFQNSRREMLFNPKISKKQETPQESMIFLYNVSLPKLYIDDINFWSKQEILNHTKDSLSVFQRIHRPIYLHKSGDSLSGGQ